MSDFPFVAPPADGLERAFADARRRRLRSAGLSTSALGVAGVLVLAALTGSGTQSLVQQPAPEQPAVSRMLPEVQAPLPSTERVNQVGAVAGSQPSAGSVLTSSGSDTRIPVVIEGPTGKPGTARLTRDHSAATQGGYSAPDLERSDNVGFSATNAPTCGVAGYDSDRSGSLCTTAFAPSPGTTGSMDLTAEVCSTRTQVTLLSYQRSNEVDLEVLHKGQVVWRWSTWHKAVRDPHKVGLEAQSCTQWSVPWTLVDRHGERVANGDYELRTTYFADQLTRGSEPMRSSTTFTIG